MGPPKIIKNMFWSFSVPLPERGPPFLKINKIHPNMHPRIHVIGRQSGAPVRTAARRDRQGKYVVGDYNDKLMESTEILWNTKFV
jgi:hypothetical protein